jgi:hypothetical protein
MFKVICIDDKNRPDGIPTSKWVKKDQEYTVIHIGKLNLQGGILGFKLEELNIDDCFPYQFFAATRFALPKKDKSLIEKIEEDLIIV